jgi:DNA-directed RNA polymerase subunit K/omega
MLYPKLEECVQNVGCKFTLTILVGKRMKEIGMKNAGDFRGNRKELTCALDDVFNKKIVPIIPKA